jgi:hypothetical protein
MGARPDQNEIRCKSCGILLAKIDDSGLTIRRGDMQATFDGQFHASLVCYRASCKTLNVIRVTPSNRSR